MECSVHPDQQTEVSCISCGKPICANCQVQISGKTLCKSCETSLRGKIARELEREAKNPNYFLAGISGLLVALVGAIIWDKIAFYTNYKLGIVAWGIGIAVGLAVMNGAGNKKGLNLQILAGVLGALGIIAGEFLLWTDSLAKLMQLHGDYVPAAAVYLRALTVFPEHLKRLQVFDWVFIAFGIYFAYRVPEASRLKREQITSQV